MYQDMPEYDQTWSLETARKHIASAQGGSSKKLNFLVTNCGQVPSEALLDATNLFFPAFDLPNGFDPLEPLPDALKPRYEQVKICLHGLISFGERLRKNSTFNENLEASWPDILKWAHFYFIDNCTENTSATKIREGELHALGQLSKLFVVFSSVGKGYSNPNHRDDTLALLTNVWLKMVPKPALDTIAPRDEIMGQMCSALANAVSCPSWSLSSALDIILGEARDQASVVAKVALTALQDAPNFQTDIDSMKFIDKSVLAVCYLLSQDVREDLSSTILQAFVDQRAVKIITQTFRHFSTGTIGTLENAWMIPSTCINIFYAILDSRIGFIMAPQILRYGFLEGLADHVGYLYPIGILPFDQRMVFHDILDKLLPALLVHYPVICSAIQATNLLLLSNKIGGLSSGITSSEWGLFFDTLLERATVKAHYDLYLETQNHVVCHNCGETSNEIGQKFITCSGCKIALYCSSACQEEAWNSISLNHKQECGTLKKSTTDKYYNHHSTQFLPKLVAYDIKRHLPGIQKLRTAGSDLSYTISYADDKNKPTKEIAVYPTPRIEKLRRGESSNTTSSKAQYATKASKVHEDHSTQVVYVTLYRGGRRQYRETLSIPKSDFQMPVNAIVGSPSGKSNPRRRKARDEKGRELETLWDSIDETMYRALKEEQEEQYDAFSNLNAQETIFDRIVRVAKEVVDQSPLEPNLRTEGRSD